MSKFCFSTVSSVLSVREIRALVSYLCGNNKKLPNVLKKQSRRVRRGRPCCSAIKGKNKREATVQLIRHFHQTYYDAITESNRRGDSGPFIDFMLREIYQTLKSHQGNALDVGENVGINVGTNVGENERKILAIILHTPSASAKEMAEALGVTTRQCERILAAMKQRGLIVRIGANKGGHWEIVK